MVAKEAGNDRVVHHRLVGLILEIRVPATAELGAHLSQLLLGWADLDASLDTVGRQRPTACRAPLVKYLLLHPRVTAGKVVEGLGVRLRTED